MNKHVLDGDEERWEECGSPDEGGGRRRIVAVPSVSQLYRFVRRRRGHRSPGKYASYNIRSGAAVVSELGIR